MWDWGTSEGMKKWQEETYIYAINIINEWTWKWTVNEYRSNNYNRESIKNNKILGTSSLWSGHHAALLLTNINNQILFLFLLFNNDNTVTVINNK